MSSGDGAHEQEVAPDTERFVIEQRLGSGGMGIVYRAFDRERGDYVALKTLRRLEPSSLYRFKREFRSLADVHHANLVSLYELFARDGAWFFTMELLEGNDFSDHVRSARSVEPLVDADSTRPVHAGARGNAVDYERLRYALGQLAGGVGALHASGHLHGDIKPSNVIVTDAGRVVLLDFGVITQLAGLRAGVDEVIGTPLYMAPELASPTGVASPATDWYAVGVMLYMLLTGRRPFGGDPALLFRSNERAAPPPSTFAPDVPSELDALICALLDPRPEHRAGSNEILAWTGGVAFATARRANARVARVSLSGRDRELADLHGAYQLTRAGAGVTVFVHGGSGMGKTALVNAFLDEVDDDTVVLTGRCYERETVPYQGVDSVVDALSQYLAGLPAHEVAAFLPRDIRMLERVFPVLRRVEAVAQARRRELGALEAPQLRARAFAALRELLGRIASQQPVVVHIDDVQWGDVDSAPLLADLMRPPNEPPVLLVLNYRTEDGERSPLVRLLLRRDERLGPASRSRTIEVRPLAFSDACSAARELLSRAGLATDQAAVLARESGGTPYFLEELVGYAASAGVSEQVPTLEAAILARVERLAPHVRRLLELICLAGQPVRLDIVLPAASLEGSENEAMHLLRSQKLARFSGIRSSDTVEPYHDRIRETVSRDIGRAERQQLHRTLASALRRGNADAERLAWHYLAAGDRHTAGECALEAAYEADQALAFERAARHFELALDCGPDLDARQRGLILAARGNALANSGHAAAAADAYLESVATDTREDAVDLQRAAAEHLLRSGHIDRGMSILRTVLASVGLGFPDGSVRALVTLLVRRARLRLRGLRFRVRDEAEIPPSDLRLVDLCSSIALNMSMIDTVLGASFQTHHALMALRTGEITRVVRALSTEVAYSATGGSRNRRRTAKLLDTVDRLADSAEQRAQNAVDRRPSAVHRWHEQAPYLRGYAALTRGVAAYLEGRFPESRMHCQAADEAFREGCNGVDWEVDMAQLFALFAAAQLGDLNAVRRGVTERLRECQRKGDLYGTTNLRTRLSYIPLLADDQAAAAEAEAASAVEVWSHTSFHLQHYYHAFAQCEIDLYRSAGGSCLERARRTVVDLERSRLWRIQLVRIEAHTLCGRGALAAAGTQRNPEQRHRLLRVVAASARAIDREKAPFGRPLATLLRAGAFATAGESTAALAHLDAAEESFRRFGMSLHAAACAVARGVLDDSPDLLGLAALRDRGIVRPDRYAAMLAPGFFLASEPT